MTAVHHDASLDAYSDVEYVFEPQSSSVPPVGEYVADVWRRREFIRALAKSDIEGKRSNRLLGQVWAILDPLFQAAIYWFLITLVRGSAAGGPSPAQRAALIIGCMFLFSLYRVAFGDAGREIQKRKGLVLNSTFPMAMFPLTALYRGVLEFVPAIGIYAIIHVAAGMPIGPGIFLLPLLFLLQLTMSFGMSLLIATAMIFVKDTANVMNYVMRVVFFMTPVIYPVSALDQAGPVVRTVLWLNPLFPLFAAYQAILTGGVPSAVQVIVTAAWSVFFLVVGYRVFVANERAFAIRL